MIVAAHLNEQTLKMKDRRSWLQLHAWPLARCLKLKDIRISRKCYKVVDALAIYLKIDFNT